MDRDDLIEEGAEALFDAQPSMLTNKDGSRRYPKWNLQPENLKDIFRNFAQQGYLDDPVNHVRYELLITDIAEGLIVGITVGDRYDALEDASSYLP